MAGPVTARDVITSWTAGDSALLPGASFEAPDDRTLVVRLATESSALPPQLADPGLSVTRPTPDQGWPTGSGAYRADTSAGRVMLSPVVGLAAGRCSCCVRSALADARDWLDRGIDLLVTDDASRTELRGEPS